MAITLRRTVIHRIEVHVHDFTLWDDTTRVVGETITIMDPHSRQVAAPRSVRASALVARVVRGAVALLISCGVARSAISTV